MKTRTFTVNVPERFPAVSSDKVASVLRTVVAQRIELSPDRIGSGPKVLRVTVDESDAEALRRLAGGASMALAFRRLFCTAVDGRKMLSGLSRKGLVGSAVESVPVLRKVPAKRETPVQSVSVPSWYWRSLGVPMQLRILGAHGVAAPHVESVRTVVGQRKQAWGFTVLLVFALLLMFGFGMLFGKPSGPGSASVGRYPEWRPQ